MAEIRTTCIWPLREFRLASLGPANYEHKNSGDSSWLLPLRFNDGAVEFPTRSLVRPCSSCESNSAARFLRKPNDSRLWEHRGQVYRDDLMSRFVDAPDIPESRDFFVSFKDRVKSRFRQIDIWMTTYRIEVL